MRKDLPHIGTFVATEQLGFSVYKGYREETPETPVVGKMCHTNSKEFLAEVGTMNLLNRYPAERKTNIAYLSGYEQITSRLVICFSPYVRGIKLLNDFISHEKENYIQFRHSLWPLSAITAFLLQLGETLDFLHDTGTAHNDLHDENILTTAKNEGKHHFITIDFGRAVVGEDLGLGIEYDRLNLRNHTIRMLLSGLPNVPKGDSYIKYENDSHIDVVREKYGKRVERSLNNLYTNSSSLYNLGTQLIDDLVSRDPGFIVSLSQKTSRRSY